MLQYEEDLKKKEEKRPSVVPGNPAGEGGRSADLGAQEPSQKWDETANFGVRSYLENELGADGSRIGFDGKSVTFDGKPLVDAGRVSEEGRSYVKDQEALDGSVGKFIEDNGMVGVRDYVNSRGVPMNVDWDGSTGSVLVNGTAVKPDFVVDGKAYIYQDKLDPILKKADGGMQSFRDRVDKAEERLAGIDNFFYRVKDDKAYQDFLDMYRRAVSEEYGQNLAQSRFRTGGVPSMAMQQNAAAIRQNALEDLAGFGQQFEDRAYSRWQDEKADARADVEQAWRSLGNMEGLQGNQESRDWTNRFNKLQLNSANDEFAVNSAVNASTIENLPFFTDLEKRNALIETQLAEKGLNWYDFLQLLDTAGVITNGQLASAQNGGAYPAAELWKMWKSLQ